MQPAGKVKSQASLIINSLFTVGLRWTDRLIGVISTLILARLLAPDDFGVIAMATLVVTLVEVLFSLGVHVPLIQRNDITQEHYNAAWTLKVLQTVFSILLIWFAAPFAADYFKDERLVLVMRIISFHLLLMGIENIGVVSFQKEMNFAMDFKYRFSKRLVGFLTTIIAAWTLKSYWALVIGTVATSGVGAVLSYVMHPMRPRFSTRKMKEIFSVSQWLLIDSIGNFLNHRMHHACVGRVGSASMMGGYDLANQIAEMPSEELLAPINRVLFPAFSHHRSNPVELKKLFLMAQGAQSIIAIPASIGLFFVAPELVMVMLGEKWVFIVPILQVLVLANICIAIVTSGIHVMLATEKVRALSLITWIRVVMFLILFLLLSPSSAYEIAQLYLASMVAGFFLIIWQTKKSIGNVTYFEMFSTVNRPIIAATIMFFLGGYVVSFLDLNVWLVLGVKIFIGVAIYSIVISVLWVLSGMPSGAESYTLEKIKSMRNRSQA